LFGDLLMYAGGYENVFAAAFFDRLPPQPVFSNLSDADTETSVVPYFERAYRGDPWYELLQGGVEDGVFRLADHAGSGFTRTRYYREYYCHTRLLDECAIIVRPNPDSFLLVSLGLRPEHGREVGQLELLRLMLPCIGALCRRHWADLGPGREAATDTAADRLSRRERQVRDLVLAGQSSKAIARQLELSPETVKIYRKRMNRKLNVGSATELFVSMLRGR
jgi:DNA-binding CsgD family transcriptional regulator